MREQFALVIGRQRAAGVDGVDLFCVSPTLRALRH
jgi:hypothetical protein